MSQYPNPIDPRMLDLVMRDHDHAIYYADKVMLTPRGNEIADQDVRLLKHMLTKVTINSEVDVYNLNSFALFCFQRDYIEFGKDRIASDFENIFFTDPLVRFRSKEGRPLLDAEGALSYLDEHPAVLNLLFWGMPEIGRRLIAFYDELNEGKGGDLPPDDELSKVIHEAYDGLMNAQKSAVNFLSVMHASGLLLPMMLMMAKITPSEYATATMAINLGYEISGDEVKPIVVHDKEYTVYAVDRDQPAEAFRKLHEQAIKALEHVSFYTGGNPAAEPGIRDLIGAGEGYNLEFKTSLRWDMRQEKKNPHIEHASLKTICAFLNSSGGHLLIGVEDDGRVEGVEIDKFDNDDKFLLHFWNLVKSSLGQEVTPYIKTTLDKIDGGTVCHVRCLRSPKPVFLRQKGFGEEFYIRTGPSSTSMEIREALSYISERFPSK